MPHSLQKIHMHSCMHAYATLQKLLCHETYCELILRLARASCRLSESFSARPAAVSTKSVARRCVLQKVPSKSTLAHDAVAAAVSHKHHLIIRVDAGLIQFVDGSHSRLAVDLILHKNLFPPFFLRAFSIRESHFLTAS